MTGINFIVKLIYIPIYMLQKEFACVGINFKRKSWYNCIHNSKRNLYFFCSMKKYRIR